MSKFKRYEKYKDSGVEWIGEIPEHWTSLKVSRIFNIIGSGTTPSSSNSDYYDGDIPWVNTGDLNDNYLYDTSRRITDLALNECSALKFYPINTLLIAMYGATIGKLSITKIVATTNQACCALAQSKNANIKFIFYWFLANREHIIAMAYGGGQPNISQNLIKSLRINLPEKHEQNSIVCFLDQKTAEIDGLIADKEKLIELLQEKRQVIITEAVTKGLNPNMRMKDSGIEWIGEIPEHWEIKPLKRVFKIINGGTPNSTEESYWDGETIWITPNDLSKLTEVYIKGSERKITLDGLYNCSARIVPKGSIIISTRAPIGYVAIAGVELCTNQGCKSLVAFKKVNSKYYYYWISSINFYLNALGQGTTFTELSNDSLSMVELLIPPIKEQEEISNFLDKKTIEIDNLICS